MPNGRTDIFEVKKDKILASLGALNENEKIGVTFDQPMRPVALSELKERVLGHQGETITIEKQWEDYYIIHVGNDPYGWVS